MSWFDAITQTRFLVETRMGPGAILQHRRINASYAGFSTAIDLKR
jgi:hypothetical protein